MIKKILVIEDDKILQEALKVALESDGYKIIQSFDGESGFDKIKSENPDLILLDLIMPVRLGEWVLQQMNDEGIMNKCPLIVLSAKSEESSIINCINKYNVSNYIIKGEVGIEKLLEKIKNMIG